ncbi:histidine phosphatase family protein [Roseovarius aquimarinus]|uniref:histidine phosphatase family protein n=1 Tax=Roseovarius aquimarinus TaxID=1229156 RepID=UPI003640018F
MAGPGGIYVSPLGRARETAAIALPGTPAVVDPRLAEIDTGAWEGRLKSELPKGASDLETYAAAPGGEGLDALMIRVRNFADGLRGPSIVVAHGLWGQVLRGLAQGMAFEEMGAQENGQGCVYHLEDGRERRIGSATAE